MSPLPTLLRGRVLILAGLITWITTVPLSHIHIPDRTDRGCRDGGQALSVNIQPSVCDAQCSLVKQLLNSRRPSCIFPHSFDQPVA